MIAIRWLSGSEKGWIDLLSPSLFEHDCKNIRQSHDLLHGKQRHPADFEISVEGASATLVYSKQKVADEGTMLLTFSDERRERVTKVSWADPEGEFQSADVDIENLFDDSLIEGEPRIVFHLIRERDASLRRQKLDAAASPISCEACGDDLKRYQDSGSMFEVHHLRPLSDGARKTCLKDLAILCPTCHRSIHRPFRPLEALRSELSSV